jgi:hypothetical protein
VVAIEAEHRLRRMYDETYHRLLGYALGYLDRASAEEIVSEAFLIAWRRIDDVPSRELPWLIGVTRNLIRERYRADQRLRDLCADLGAEARADRGAVGDIAEDVTDRAAALRALAEPLDRGNSRSTPTRPACRRTVGSSTPRSIGRPPRRRARRSRCRPGDPRRRGLLLATAASHG